MGLSNHLVGKVARFLCSDDYDECVIRKRKNIKDLIRALFDDKSELANRDIAAATGMTPQGVHYHLRAMVDTAELEVIGAGRSTRYRRRGTFSETLVTAGLQEHLVWSHVKESVPELATIPDNVERLLNYAFTEMLNNVIDHSGSKQVAVTASVNNGRAELVVRDFGVGALEHVRQQLALTDLQDAVVAISKGKTTTAPDAHTGQGIFFTSKAVDVFVLESNGVTWIVDNTARDTGLGESDIDSGTRVSLALAVDSTVHLPDVFDEYAPDLDFEKTRVFVELANLGSSLVSRSEAKRVAADLERFSEALIDFSGVEQVGQGFSDELFRVWASAHPGTVLTPVGMTPAIESVVVAALPEEDKIRSRWARRQGVLPLGTALTEDSTGSAERTVSGDLR